MAMAATNDSKTVKLRVIETSDVHGYFFPYDFISRKPLKGTLARVSTYVNRLREQYGDNLLLLDNGDILQGQPTCYYTNYVMPEQPNVAAKLTNYMRYNAETIGNHDVETGHHVYDKWIREVRCPMLGANIVDRETGQPFTHPYSIHMIDGVKIAVLGMLTPAIPNWLHESLWQGLEFKEMVTCAQYWVKRIQEDERPDLLFGLFHSGLNGGIRTPEYAENATEEVARQVPGFDIIFFGHDHTMHNTRIENVAGDSVLCLDPSCFAQMVADAKIELTYENGILKHKHITGTIQSIADEEVDKQLVNHFQTDIDHVKAYVDRQLGTFDESIHAQDCFFGSAPFTDYIHNLQLRITGADISFNAPLVYDAAIEKGPVRVSDLFKLYRYENMIYVLNLTGQEVRRHLEMSYDLWVNTMHSPQDHIMRIRQGAWTNDGERFGFENMTFNFDSAAGIDYEVDVTKPDGEKVHILRMSNGEPFDEDRWYRVAMNSYRGNGGGELLTLGAGIPHDSLPRRIVYQSQHDERYYIMKDIEAAGHVTAKANGNWRFVPEEWAGPALLRDRAHIFGH